MMPIIKDRTLNGNLAETLLASISDIIESTESIKTEKEKFITTGCYLYRVSVVVMELQTNQDTSGIANDVAGSLSTNIDTVKDLVEQCQRDNEHISKTQLTSRLDGIVKQLGECLQSVAFSSFGDQEYAEIAVRSLSNEMRKVDFKHTETEALEPESLMSGKLQESKPIITETDLYPIDVELLSEPSVMSSMPHPTDFHKSTRENTSYRSQKSYGSKNSSITTMQQLTQFANPLYETFFCPLTKEIMEDPVTLETGVTYERKVITEWFQSYQVAEDIVCPATGKKIISRSLSTNIALKTTIEEWKKRNEASIIKSACAALSLAGPESMVMEAINSLQKLCQEKQYNKVQVCNVAFLPLLGKLLANKDPDIRCAVMELLSQLAEDDDDSKEIIGRTIDMSAVIRLLSSRHQSVRHAALIFLLELSKSQFLCENIGSITGGILILITTMYNRHTDAFASEISERILRNLEKIPENIKCMAENGLLQPLAKHLTEGCDETQLQMASYLGEIVLGHDSKAYAAETASPALLAMLRSGNTLKRSVAFRALAQISSYHPIGNKLLEAGVLKFIAEEMFTSGHFIEPMNSKNEAAAILADIVESGIDYENFHLNTHGHTMASDYVVYNVINMLKNSTPDELNINLIRILVCLTNSPKSMATIVSVIKETEASISLTELVNNPHEQLGIAAMKLLISLSPFIGHTLAEKLCKTRGQPENLIQYPYETNQITERQAVSAKFLAELPHENLTLNLALSRKNTISTVLQNIHIIQKSGTRTSRYATSYLEGLVGILVRFTATLYEPQMLYLARNHNLTLILTEQLMTTSSDEIRRLAAVGLDNLSSVTMSLCRPPETKLPKLKSIFSFSRSSSSSLSRKKEIPICPIHRGVCSAQNTFCLIEANAVPRLLVCLESDNTEVVEASLSAICTLLGVKVDVEKSVHLLIRLNAIQYVLDMLKEPRKEGVVQKAFWMIERFLVIGGDQSASQISHDRLLPAMLINYFHHGDSKTSQAADKILRHLNKMPDYSTTYTM